jgi:cardiolipin synthase
MFHEARSEIQLMASYFVPSGALKRAMDGAARRGVPITVIMAGRSDVWIAKLAERWLYGWLLQMGVQVYEYEKAVLHAKVAVRDGAWCTLGSFNLNDLSNYTTLEVNLDVADAPLAGGVRTVMERTAREDCRRITAADLRHAGPLDRFAQWCAYRALRLLHRVFTFYYRRER